MLKRSALAAELLELTPDDYVSHRLIDRVPAVFDDRSAYIAWKKDLAAGLRVDPYGVILVGSACTGYSLNPHKNFRDFHERSDFDVAVVSDQHFDEAWRFLRDLGVQIHKLPSATKKAVNSHRSGHVFDGVIATDTFVEHLPFGKTWVPVLEAMTLAAPANGRKVNRNERDLVAFSPRKDPSTTVGEGSSIPQRLPAPSCQGAIASRRGFPRRSSAHQRLSFAVTSSRQRTGSNATRP